MLLTRIFCRIVEFYANKDLTDIALFAMKDDSARIIRWLLVRGMDVDFKIDGNTLLCEAAFNGCMNVASLLLGRGADPNSRGRISYGPLHYAVKNANEEMISLLLDKGANMESRDCDERPTPLHIAVHFKHANIVSSLLEKGANVESKDEQGDTPLHLAAYSQPELDDITRLLLNAGANPSAINCYGSTPLHDAVLSQNVKIVSLLLDKAANVDVIRDDGWTPLHLAVQSKSDDITRLLLNAGANTSVVDCGGWTPLHHAITDRHDTAASMLLQYGSDANAKTPRYDYTPLQFAAMDGRWDIAYELLKHGASISAANCLHETPLHDAVRLKHTDFLQQLLKYIEQNCDLSVLNAQQIDDGYTAVRIAINKGFADILQMLLESGADFTLSSASGESDLDAALKSGNERIREIGQKLKYGTIRGGHQTNISFALPSALDPVMEAAYTSQGGQTLVSDHGPML